MKWLTFFFTLFILLIIILADLGKLGILRVINQIPFGDKIGHFILYGILSLLLDLSLLRSLPNRSPKLIVVISGLTLALLIALEEWSQKLFSTRTFDLVDLFAGLAGLLVGGWAAYKINVPKTNRP